MTEDELIGIFGEEAIAGVAPLPVVIACCSVCGKKGITAVRSRAERAALEADPEEAVCGKCEAERQTAREERFEDQWGELCRIQR